MSRLSFVLDEHKEQTSVTPLNIDNSYTPSLIQIDKGLAFIDKTIRRALDKTMDALLNQILLERSFDQESLLKIFNYISQRELGALEREELIKGTKFSIEFDHNIQYTNLIIKTYRYDDGLYYIKKSITREFIEQMR